MAGLLNLAVHIIALSLKIIAHTLRFVANILSALADLSRHSSTGKKDISEPGLACKIPCTEHHRAVTAKARAEPIAHGRISSVIEDSKIEDNNNDDDHGKADACVSETSSFRANEVPICTIKQIMSDNGDEADNETVHNDTASDAGSSASDDDDLVAFHDMLAALNYDMIPQLCSRIRVGLTISTTTSTTPEHPEEQYLPTVMKPSYGSYHAVYPIRFNDGTKWALKIPCCSTETQWNEQSEQAMLSEVHTMQMLLRETTIPIPEVFAYDATLTNDLGCPYVLMQYVEGVQLCDYWHNKTPGFDLQQFRQNALRDLANAMAQLESFSSDTSGPPTFDADGVIIGTSSMLCKDAAASRCRWFYEQSLVPVVFDWPSTDDSQDFFYHAIDHIWPEKKSIMGEDMTTFTMWLCRKFIDWTPRAADPRKKFVLGHPDFNFQNVIVAEDGHLRALIDWDGVCFVPRSLGYEGQPMWLTRDWGACSYGWNEDMERGVKGDTCWEDSPATLDRHRAEYAYFMRSALSKLRQESAGLEHIYLGCQALPFYSANSKIVQTLQIASADHIHAQYMVPHLLGQLEKVREVRRAEAAASSGAFVEDDETEDDDQESFDGSDGNNTAQFDAIEDDMDENEDGPHSGEDDGDDDDPVDDDAVSDPEWTDTTLAATPPASGYKELTDYNKYRLYWKLDEGERVGEVLAELKADYQSLFRYD